MVALALLKTQGGYVPATHEDQLIADSHKIGEVIRADFKKMRNPGFHRKFFALIKLGFDAFEPKKQESKYGEIMKNPEQFRHDITILAGHYLQSYRVNGDIITTAKSIKFSSMSPHEFNQLYSSAIDVLLREVLTHYKDQAEIDEVVEKVMSFA